MAANPYWIQLADGVPMAFPADHSLEDIRGIAAHYANGGSGGVYGDVVIRREETVVAVIRPDDKAER